MSRSLMVGLIFASVALLMSSAAAQVPDYDYQPDNSISPANSEDGNAYAPVTIEYGFPPQNSDQCGNDFNLKCVEEIYGGMFKAGPITKNCCKSLVQMGYGCHIRLASSTLANPEYGAEASVALAKSEQIWQSCVSAVETSRFEAALAPL